MRKTKLQNALKTLLYSWGHDTPQEVIWGLNEVVEIIEAECNVNLPRFVYAEEDDEDEFGNSINSSVAAELAKFIESKLNC